VSTSRRGLGRGLGALIPGAPGPHRSESAVRFVDNSTPESTTSPTASVTEDAVSRETSRDEPGPVLGAYYAEIPVGRIIPNPRQPRQSFDEESMQELVGSVREVGLLQPVVVRSAPSDTFELVMGERRWRASQAAGLGSIPAIVRDTTDDDLLRDALLENLHRADLNPLEEAAAYQQLLDDFGCTHDELASRIGRSRPQISNTLRLLKLTPPVQRRVAAGVLSAGHARALVAVDPEQQEHLAQRVVAEGISVRGLEELLALQPSSGQASKRTRSARPQPPEFDDLASRLGDRLETRVRIDLGRSKGRITVDFASVADLERIMQVLLPDKGAAGSAPGYGDSDSTIERHIDI
jgi:ParB family transcriptional regulator, chromosome partitioning protein